MSTSEECASIMSLSEEERREEITAPPSQGMTTSSTLVLRDYQSRGIQTLRLGLAEGWRRQMLYSPTGSGKTEMAMALVKGAVTKRKRVAFLCNRIGLVEQTSRRFRRAGIAHGVIQGQNTTRLYERVLIVSIQTAARRGLPEVDLLIVDEAHWMAASKDYRRVVAAANCPVIGLSATPFARGLSKQHPEFEGPLFEKIVIAATIPELIAAGHLVDVDVYAPSEPDMAAVKQVKNAYGEADFSDADAGIAADKPQLVGDIVEHWQRLAGGTATVCFASNILHSKHIVERFAAAGIAAEHIDCYTEEEERRAILARVEAGETMVISNVGILAEGWDFPACRTLILARPTRSLTRYIQMAGRVLRPYASKDRALILDHSGTVARLGFPTDEFPLELDDGVPRTTAAPSEREAPLPKPCPSCSYMRTGNVCPQCGFIAEKQSTEVAVKAGQLVKVARKKRTEKIGKQEFYSQLLYIAAYQGFQAGWVSHKYREYFGTWPRGLVHEAAASASREVLGFLKHRQIRNAKAKEARDARR